MHAVVQTYLSKGEGSRSEIRVRPLPGQGISTDTRVECSKQVRRQHPVGQMFLIPVNWKHAEGKESCLYVSYREPDQMVPITHDQAMEFIKATFGKAHG